MEQLFFGGDSHGNLRKILSWNKQVENSTLVHVGDFGVDSYYLPNLANELAEHGNALRIYRGNHETCKFAGQTYGDKNNLTLLADYSIIEVNGKKVLGIGGAISLDRQSRKEFAIKNPKQCSYYFDDEAFVCDENKLKSYRDIDILVTHTIPNYYVPLNDPHFVDSFAKDDPELLNDLQKERNDVQRTMDILRLNCNVTHHYHGHFHTSYVSSFGNTKIIGLGIDEIREHTDW